MSPRARRGRFHLQVFDLQVDYGSFATGESGLTDRQNSFLVLKTNNAILISE